MSNKRTSLSRKAPRPASRRALWFGVAVILGLGLGTYFVQRTSPQVPIIATTGFEPIIITQIENALAQVRAAPRSGKPWGQLGLVLQAHDFKAEAHFCFAQAERFEPAEPRWPYLHGLLLRQDDIPSALARLEKATALACERPDAPRLALAELNLETGRFDEAERHLKKVLEANPQHVAARLRLAELSDVRGQPREVRQQLEPCLTNAHTARRAHTLLARAERQLGDTAVAEAATRTLASLPPDLNWPDPFATEAAQYRIGRKAWNDQAQQCLNENRAADAQPLIARLVKDYPADPQGWLLLGRLRQSQNDCVGAEQAFRRHLQLAPDSVNGQSQLGIALLCLERYADAMASLQKAVQLKPDFADAYFNLGFAQARAGRHSDAVVSFRNAIRYSPNFVTAYVILADLLDQKGEREEAMTLLRRASQLDPSDERVQILIRRVQR
jgi:tetratricopeptide (TPR) repeat protein